MVQSEALVVREAEAEIPVGMITSNQRDAVNSPILQVLPKEWEAVLVVAVDSLVDSVILSRIEVIELVVLVPNLLPRLAPMNIPSMEIAMQVDSPILTCVEETLMPISTLTRLFRFRSKTPHSIGLFSIEQQFKVADSKLLSPQSPREVTKPTLKILPHFVKEAPKSPERLSSPRMGSSTTLDSS